MLLLLIAAAFMIFFEHFLRALMTARTFPGWKVFGFFININANHCGYKTNNRKKHKYFNQNCTWIFKHKYAFLLLRILIVTNTLTTRNIIANVTGKAQAMEDVEKMLKKQ